MGPYQYMLGRPMRVDELLMNRVVDLHDSGPKLSKDSMIDDIISNRGKDLSINPQPDSFHRGGE